MPQTTANFPSEVSANVVEYFAEQFEGENFRDAGWTRIFNTMSSPISGFQVSGDGPVQRFHETGENTEHTELDQYERDPITVTLAQYAGYVGISEFARIQINNLWQYDKVVDKTRRLALAAKRTMAQLAIAKLCDGFSDTGYDGVAVFHASHPLASGGGMTDSNLTTADLTEVAVAAGLLAMSLTLDDHGDPINVQPKILWCGQANYINGLNAVRQTYTTDNLNKLDLDPRKAGIEVVADGYIDSIDNQYWGLSVGADVGNWRWYFLENGYPNVVIYIENGTREWRGDANFYAGMANVGWRGEYASTGAA